VKLTFPSLFVVPLEVQLPSVISTRAPERTPLVAAFITVTLTTTEPPVAPVISFSTPCSWHSAVYVELAEKQYLAGPDSALYTQLFLQTSGSDPLYSVSR